MFLPADHNRGLTLIEVAVVTALVGFLSVTMIRNFSTRRLYLNEAANVVLADIRAVQQRAISGANYPDGTGLPVIRCGYGISRISATSYRTYVAPKPDVHVLNQNCTALNKNYTSSGNPTYQIDTIIQTKTMPYPNLEFKMSFSDIFFEPPDPRIYINNSSALNGSPSIITIGEIGQACTANNCRTICVYPSGAMNVGLGSSCP